MPVVLSNGGVSGLGTGLTANGPMGASGGMNAGGKMIATNLELSGTITGATDITMSGNLNGTQNITMSGNISGVNNITGSGQVTGFTKVFNAVWNDLADFQELAGELVYGKCYIDTLEGATLCTERCQMSVIGIASDTFGFGVGKDASSKEVPIAVAGWVLAYVDKEYAPGTPLTNDEYGNLTEITLEEKRNYPERIIGIYKKP